MYFYLNILYWFSGMPFLYCHNSLEYLRFKFFQMKLSNFLFSFILFLFFNTSISFSQNINEGFEGTFPPVGWRVLQNNCGNEVYWWQSDGEFDVCDGNYAALILGNNVSCGIATDWLVTPQLKPTSANHTFTFEMHQSYMQEHGSIYKIKVSTQSATNLSDFSTIKTWNESQMPIDCTVKNIDLSNYNGQKIYVAFVMENDEGDNWIIDNVSGIPMVGNCYPPTGLETFDVISTSAGLQWDNIDTVPNYFWEVVPKDNNQGVGVVTSATEAGNSTTAYGLSMITEYDYRVQSLCSSGDSSYFSVAHSFKTLGPPPANDNCDNAELLNINLDNSCTNTVSGTTLDATRSMVGCVGDSNDDVWYEFVATQSKHEIQISNVTAVVGNSIKLVLEFFEGDCNSLTSLLCSQENINTIEGLSAGNTYFFRIYSLYNTSRQTFDLCVKTPPIGPINDNCENAIVTPVNNDQNCTQFVSGTTLGSTESMPGCFGDADDDVWFSFVATSIKHSFELFNVIPVEGSNANMVHEIFSGTCSNLTSLKCSDPNTSAVTGLNIGETYYVRVYSRYNCCRQTFDFCIKTPPQPPSNDACNGATQITIGGNGTCPGNKITCSTTLATNTDYGACDNSGVDPDLWYKFTVPINGDYFFSSITGNPGISLYSGECGNLTEIFCTNNTDGTISGLVIGETYYARIYTDYPEANVEFCIEKDPSAPTIPNDLCSGALKLTIGEYGSCPANQIICSTSGASNTDYSECDGGGNDPDLWFWFIAPQNGDYNFSSITGDPGITLYTGECNSLVEIDCSNNESTKLEDLFEGETYYVRIYTDNPESTVEFCIEKDETPINDDCFGAALLTVGNGYCNEQTIGTNLDATNSQGLQYPGCGNYNGSDVWFKVVVPSSGQLRIEMSRIGLFIDGGLAIYTGECGNLNFMLCDDDGNSNFGTEQMPSVLLTGQTPGETLYIRAWEYNNDYQGNFAICAWEPSDLSLSGGGMCVEGNQVEVNDNDGNIYTWIPLEDQNGAIIAFVYPNGNQLGNIIPTIFTKTDLPLRKDANGVSYINRDIQIEVQYQPTGNNPYIRLLYTENELNQLIDASINIDGLEDMNMTKNDEDCSGVFTQTGGLFTQYSNDSVNSSGDSYLQFEIPSFSTFYIHGGSVSLPLNNILLSGYEKGNSNYISWISDINDNVDLIILQKLNNSDDRWVDLIQIDYIKQKEYNYVDYNPKPSSFYRLMIINQDGLKYYSNLLNIENNNNNSDITFSVYPNPSNGIVNLSFENEIKEKSEMYIYDIDGKIVKNLIIDNNSKEFKFDLKNEPDGIYFLKVISGDYIKVEKLILSTLNMR